MNLPNKLTVFRILLVPIIVIIPYLNIQGEFLEISVTYLLIDFIFILASITDKLDGTIARKTNQITTFGKFLDPIADKILVLAALIMLVDFNKIPAWIPIIVLFREFIVSGYRLVASQNGGQVIAASIWGKIKTVTQMIAIILAYIDVAKFGSCFYVIINGGETTFVEELNVIQLIINFLATSMMLISVVATVFSGFDYLKGGKEILKDM